MQKTILFLMLLISFGAPPAFAASRPSVIARSMCDDAEDLKKLEAEYQLALEAANVYLRLATAEKDEKKAAEHMAEYRKEMARAEGIKKEIDALKAKQKMPKILEALSTLRDKGDYVGTRLAQSIKEINGGKAGPIVEDLQSRRQDILQLCDKVENSLADGNKKDALAALQTIAEKARYIGGRLRNYARDLGVDAGSLEDMEQRRNDMTNLVTKITGML